MHKRKFTKNFSKKAQLKIGETIIALIIFFILLSLGLIFFVGFKSVTFEQKLEEQNQLSSLRIAEQIKFLPELQCSFLGTETFDCFDKYKLKALSSKTTTGTENYDQNLKLYYATLFPDTSITIYEFPINDNMEFQETAEYNIISPNIDQVTRSNVITIPTTIHDVGSNKFSFGYVKIEVFS